MSLFQGLHGESIRSPQGMQAVLFRGAGGAALLVCHSFARCAGDALLVPAPRLNRPATLGFGAIHCCHADANGLTVRDMEEFDTLALYWAAP